MHNAYRDGEVHVLAEMCATCVFRKGNLMQLKGGRVREMVDSAKDAESTIVCHATLHDPAIHAVCRGFFDRHSTLPLRLAQALDRIAFDSQPTKEER